MINHRTKMYISIFVLFGALASAPIVGEYAGYSLFVGFVVGLPAYILTSRDVLNELNERRAILTYPNIMARITASIPGLVFGATSLAIGVSLILWVLYNIFIEQQAEFKAHTGIGAFGIGPPMAYFGYSLLSNVAGKVHHGA